MFSNDNDPREAYFKEGMESSIHLCWSSEAELDELQLMGEGLKQGKKKVRVKWEKAFREAKVKEQQAEVRGANKGSKSKAKNVKEATKSTPGGEKGSKQ